MWLITACMANGEPTGQILTNWGDPDDPSDNFHLMEGAGSINCYGMVTVSTQPYGRLASSKRRVKRTKKPAID